MMPDAPLKEVVDVSISINTPISSEVDFQLTALFQTDIVAITPAERYRIYVNAADVATDFPGIATNDVQVRNFASTYFGQSPSPAELMIVTVDLVGLETYADIAVEVFGLKGYTIGAVADLTISFSDIQDVALAILGLPVMFGFQADQADCLVEAPVLLANNDARIFYIQRDDPLLGGEHERNDAAFIGRGVARPVGSVNWGLQTLTGVNGTELSLSEQQNLLDLRVNIYGKVGGIDITRNGTCFSQVAPNYIDEVRAIDFMQNLIQVEVFNALVNRNVPYTDSGFNQIAAGMHKALDTLVNDGVIVQGYNITVPTAASATSGERATRTTPAFKFTAELAGFVNKVIINGSLEI